MSFFLPGLVDRVTPTTIGPAEFVTQFCILSRSDLYDLNILLGWRLKERDSLRREACDRAHPDLATNPVGELFRARMVWCTQPHVPNRARAWNIARPLSEPSATLAVSGAPTSSTLTPRFETENRGRMCFINPESTSSAGA